MYRVIVKYDKSWRNFLGRRWRIVDQWPLEYREAVPVGINYYGVALISHKKRVIGARCNPLEILKEWQAWRRENDARN